MGDDRPERVWSAPPSCYYLEEPSTSDDDATRPCSTASCDDAILLNTFQYSYSERVIRLAVTILHDFQAIPIRVKILLDKLLTTVSEDELVYMLHQSGWTWLDYCRGYKTEDPPGFLVSDWHMVDELRAMERFTAFPLCNPLLQGLRTGFLSPWTPIIPTLPRPIPPQFSHQYRREPKVEMQSSSLDDVRINVTDSPSPAPTVAGDASPPVSAGTPQEDTADILKLKKRVTCDVCQKSFCDKGALKIHTSAVHLKEMHMCTVPGCGKEFSSRRSRNRHSSNTNPKLHMPEGAQQPTFRDQVALSMAVNGMPHPQCLMTSPIQAVASSSVSPTSTSPSSPILVRKRKAEDLRHDPRPLDLSWRMTGLPAPAKLPYPFPTADLQLMLLQQIVQAQNTALGGILNNMA